MRRFLRTLASSAVVLAAAATALLAQQQQAPRVIPEDNRPPLFFRESWKNPEVQERKVVQADLASPSLELKLHGPAAEIDADAEAAKARVIRARGTLSPEEREEFERLKAKMEHA